MATSSRLEASQKVRNDHELFLEAYERPTQIYRFLKTRHSLQPLFLQRNLSYMNKHRTRSKQNRISLEKLVETTNEDISQEIKSDSHLNISFESIYKQNDFLHTCDEESDSDDEPFKDGSLMEIEVVLYRFKHPTPEALITSNPTSLSCICTSLGKCVVPYSSMSPPSRNLTRECIASSISIPGSVLSWKGTNGVLGTHMLAIRVSPFVESSNGELEHTRKRRIEVKTNILANNSVVPPEQRNGVDTPDVNRENSVPNGMINKPGLKKKHRNLETIPDQICNGVVDEYQENHYTPEIMKRLHRKVPGGKKLPTVSEKAEKLVVSLPRNILLKEMASKPRTHKKRTQLELLIDSSIGKMQGQTEKNNMIGSTKVWKTLKGNLDIYPQSALNPRKRNFNNSSLANEDGNTPEQPVSKRICVVTEDSSGQNTCPLSPLTNSTTNDQQQVYSAELVAFDSRQECLLVDGEYELLLQCSSQSKSGQINDPMDSCTGFHTSSNEGTILSVNESALDEGCNYKTLTLKFTARWVPSPPKPRTNDMMESAYDLLKLRKSYDGTSQASNSDIAQRDGTSSISVGLPNVPVKAATSTPGITKPTIFNFLYSNDTLQQTELKENFTCPWCSLDCKQLYCLLKHMMLCHPRFRFTYNPTEKGLPCVDVRINKHFDTKMSSTDPVDVIGRDAVMVRRRPTRLKPTTSVLVNGCEDNETFDLKEFTPRRQLPAPELFRTFYHSQTCLPMLPKERDCEEEGGTEWLKTTSMKMVDEFIDVNFGEKQFMKVWNTYMMDRRVLADKQVLQTCLTFAREKLDELREKNITNNLMSHIIYLCDIGLVPSSAIREVFKIITHSPTTT